jgi:hypothetical protein
VARAYSIYKKAENCLLSSKLNLIMNWIVFNKRIMIAITREDYFVSGTAGECRNLSERVVAIIPEQNTILFL